MKLSPFALLVAVLAPALAFAGMRARYGGELRVVVPAPPQSSDPALVGSAADLVVARLSHETLLQAGPDGALVPALALAVEADPAGRSLRVRLPAGLKFTDGSPLRAREVAASLARLADTSVGSPFASALLPIAGAREVAAGSASLVSGFTAPSDTELQIALAFPYPDWPRALAHPALGLTSSRGRGSGPFTPDERDPARFAAFADGATGRPFADAVKLVAGDTRAASRALTTGEADFALAALPDRPGGEGPALLATYLALNARRLGPRAAPLMKTLEASVDVAALARTYGRATPMYGLLPPLLDAASANARPKPPKPALPAELSALTLLADGSADDQKAVADRLQIKLHDLGVNVNVRRLPRAELRSALARGDYDLALVGFSLLPEPGLALAQLVHFASGLDPARDELRTIGAGADVTARKQLAAARAAALRDTLPLLPLYVQGIRLAARPNVALPGFDASGAPAFADAWFLDLPRRK